MTDKTMREAAPISDDSRSVSRQRVLLPLLSTAYPPVADADSRPAATYELETALALAGTRQAVSVVPLKTTSRRTLSRRGIIWLGQTCNLHCEFCYFIDRVHDRSHPEHGFMPLAKAKAICTTLVHVYGNTSVDIEGGEPTLYPDILELLTYCNSIGLSPTLITNGLLLDRFERCRAYKDAGINDFLISVHGLGAVHDRVVGRQGAHTRQMRALRNLQEIGIPFRFNVVLTAAVVPQLPDVARLAAATGAACVNWLGFNPHEDQQHRDTRFQLMPRFSELRDPLAEAMDILDTARIESNVRYVPLCVLPERHRKGVYTFQQMFYDHHEWDLASWAWTTLPPQRETEGPLSPPITLSSLRRWARLINIITYMSKSSVLDRILSAKRLVNNTSTRAWLYRLQNLLPSAPAREEARKATLYDSVARAHARLNCASTPVPVCRECAARNICSGVYKDYAHLYGADGLAPITHPTPIRSPLHYVGNQIKRVESQDEQWALP